MNTKLKERRMKLGFTQVQIAEKASISERAYQNYENGEQVPNVQTAKLIAKALKSKVEDIF
jgi:DNA-binding helix-turn-helix protein